MFAAAEIRDTVEEGQSYRHTQSSTQQKQSVPAPRQQPDRFASLPHALSRTAPEVSLELLAATAPVTSSPEHSHGFRLLQQWEGVIEAVGKSDFTAVLRDLTDRRNPEERAEFSIDQIDPPDRKLLIAGAVFYWWIGYRDAPTGTRWTVSTMRVRRLPAWTRTDMTRIEREVSELRRLFDEE